MRRLLFFILAVCCCLVLPAQNVSLSELEGLTDTKGDKSFEWAGYNIYITKIKTSDNEKGISKIKKKYKIDAAAKEYSDSSIGIANHVIESVTAFEKGGQSYPDIELLQLLYIIKNGKNESDLILFTKAGKRDGHIEKTFLDLYLNNKLSDYMVPTEIGSINFVGRHIRLGNLCMWASPHNIYCGEGQISWSVFDSPEKAADKIDMFMFKNKDNNSVIIDDIDIPVVFEGDSVVARRIVYKPVQNNFYDRNPLIVYYLCTEIEGKYVSCIMSHRGYNKDDYELPDMLREFMQIEELPEQAWNKYDRPIRDALTPEQEQTQEEALKEIKFEHYFLNVKTGAYFPLAGRKNILGTSPYISVGFYTIGYYSSSLFIDFSFVIPNDRKYFNYRDKEVVMEAKAQTLVNLNFGYIHKKKLKRDVYWENYGKLGIGALTTNKEKPEEDKNGNKPNYDASVFSFSLGSNIRYKRVGLFLEYQFAPYNMSKYLETGGKSALIAGMNVVF